MATRAKAPVKKRATQLDKFKEEVSRVISEKIEEYSVDLCREGLNDLTETLGIPPIATKRECYYAPNFRYVDELFQDSEDSADRIGAVIDTWVFSKEGKAAFEEAGFKVESTECDNYGIW